MSLAAEIIAACLYDFGDSSSAKMFRHRRRFVTEQLGKLAADAQIGVSRSAAALLPIIFAFKRSALLAAAYFSPE